MFKQLQRRRDEQGGFTLIELLIVIIILGILAAIVVFAVGNTRSDSVTNSCRTDAKAIQLSLEGQKTTGGAYPTATGINPTGALSNGSTPAGALLKTWPGGTDATKDDYVFTYSSTDGKSYSVSISGKSVKGTGAAPLPAPFTDTADTAAAACAKA